MNGSNIYHINMIMQDCQEGKFTMHGIALTNLIHHIVREYGQYDHGTYSVFLSDIDLTDRKLLLSHILESADYEWAMQSESRLTETWNENKKFIEGLIDAECLEVYREDMEEMGMTSRKHADNGEVYWAKR